MWCGVDDESTLLYPFSNTETKRQMITDSEMYIRYRNRKKGYKDIDGGDDGDDDRIWGIQLLYEGEKLSSFGFKAIFKEVVVTTPSGGEGIVSAEAFMPGMSMNPHVDATIGVDLLAIVSMGYSLAGDPSSAGALAGAGVY